MSSVSVVIPYYSYGHFLEEGVNSVPHSQDGVEVRVLIVDVCSSDDGAQVAKRIAVSGDRVELVVHPESRRGAITCDRGLIETDADYCIVLSADDKLAPGARPLAADLVYVHPDIGFVYDYLIHFREGMARPEATTKVHVWFICPGHVWRQRRFRASTGCITGPEVVARTLLQRRVGGYDRGIYHTSDIEMWLRLAANADVEYVRGVDQAHYHIHGSNLSKKPHGLVDLSQQKHACGAILERYGLHGSTPVTWPTPCTASRLGRHCGSVRGRMTAAASARLRSTTSWPSPSTACPRPRRWQPIGASACGSAPDLRTSIAKPLAPCYLDVPILDRPTSQA
jgi:hypothetical protein